jgi:hypothetical protein
MVLAWGQGTTNTSGAIVLGTLPELSELSDVIPATARRYLYQAQESLHSPDGAVMLAASAVDAMLKAKGYQDGRSPYSRIKAAADDHLITADMALWAHQVRLEANNPRHSDEENRMQRRTERHRLWSLLVRLRTSRSCLRRG